KKRKEVQLSGLPVSSPTLDIGKQTIAAFSKEIKTAELIVSNGTMGVFEQKEFALGTKKIFAAISKSKGFSLLGGGDTLTALAQFKFKTGQFGHVSLAGKALLEYLSGMPLPGLVALEQNAADKTAKSQSLK
ncbi:MAG: phosphoglycerate kinase, partial [Candidatus Diapherotrites archaeon]|nr:phosphoglycerate kinase [Candidatus Diapherotrites archaeon]